MSAWFFNWCQSCPCGSLASFLASPCLSAAPCLSALPQTCAWSPEAYKTRKKYNYWELKENCCKMSICNKIRTVATLKVFDSLRLFDSLDSGVCTKVILSMANRWITPLYGPETVFRDHFYYKNYPSISKMIIQVLE